jgi:hypothetical protein
MTPLSKILFQQISSRKIVGYPVVSPPIFLRCLAYFLSILSWFNAEPLCYTVSWCRLRYLNILWRNSFSDLPRAAHPHAISEKGGDVQLEGCSFLCCLYSIYFLLLFCSSMSGYRMSKLLGCNSKGHSQQMLGMSQLDSVSLYLPISQILLRFFLTFKHFWKTLPLLHSSILGWVWWASPESTQSCDLQ